MYNNLFCNNSDNSNRAVFDLGLNDKDRLANILFAIGVTLGLKSTNVTEQSILQSQTQQPSPRQQASPLYEISKLLASANEIYLIAGLIFLYTSYARLEEEKVIVTKMLHRQTKKGYWGESWLQPATFLRLLDIFYLPVEMKLSLPVPSKKPILNYIYLNNYLISFQKIILFVIIL
jgi:hypothetical protein